MLQLNPTHFTLYKLFNSLFLGVSIGAIFTLYTPLEPSVYSLGGIVLALGMLLVARAYKQLLNIVWFYRISITMELVILFAIVYFLYFSYSYQTALLVYIGYQITFMFGSYLVRAETLILKTDTLLTRVDTAKQVGYLLGMLLSFVCYKIMDLQGVESKSLQVYLLHYLLLVIEIITLLFLIKGFQKLPKEVSP
jgi:putative membrane protein